MRGLRVSADLNRTDKETPKNHREISLDRRIYKLHSYYCMLPASVSEHALSSGDYGSTNAKYGRSYFEPRKEFPPSRRVRIPSRPVTATNISPRYTRVLRVRLLPVSNRALPVSQGNTRCTAAHDFACKDMITAGERTRLISLPYAHPADDS